MPQSQLTHEFKDGKLIVYFKAQTDFDKDGKPSSEMENKLSLDAAEVISEIAKKDLPWLELMIKQVKI